MRRWVGAPPIHVVPFTLGKLAMATSYGFLVLRAAGIDPSWVVLPALRPPALVVLLAGTAILALSLVHLGSDTRVGLPGEETELRTGGVYAWSRNPMYVGVHLMALASCGLAVHPLNLACAAVSIAVHHRIVLAEERFLERRFGQAFRDYRARVRRYV